MLPSAPGHGVDSAPAAPRADRVAFRMSASMGIPVHIEGDLEEQLRHCLRIAFLIWAVASGAIAVTTSIARRDLIHRDPLTFFTAPPLPGVLLVIALVTLVMVWTLSPESRLGLARLRRIEWLGVIVTAAFFAVYQTRELAGMTPELATVPMNLGLGLAAPWGALIVAYGVLIPSSVRHGVARALVLSLCAFIPELLSIVNGPGLRSGMPTYLVLKVTFITSMSALAVYGGYSIEVLRQDAHDARRLGQYVLKRLLGKGGMGEVHLARHEYLRRPCAVKLIRADRAGDAAALARFEREVQAAAGLTHPNTIQIYDYGHTADGTFYYVMEYVPGITLEDLVAQHGPLPPARAVRILVQICGALREAHGRGLVHRDLKPGNVMLCERGGLHDVAKLLDFGLVSQVVDAPGEPLTQVGALLGTPAFMSPEQCNADTVITSSSDIYSLGAIAFFLLAGRPPLIGRSTMQMMLAHVYEVPVLVNTLRREIPDALADVVARCLEKSPSDRYPDAKSVERALRSSIEAVWSDENADEWWRKHGERMTH